ncbi:MAG: SDR family oxidoreductase [Acidimicrobiia bacterium]|nr:SDR family oxidoreductase [Acidimicrobiia bacterium]
MVDLSGQVAIVTGSSSGIGEAVARQISELGMHVVVNSARSIEAGTAVAESLATRSVYVQGDISDKTQGQTLVDTALNEFGRLDLLVNNAGWTTVVPHSDLEGLTDEILIQTFEVNVYGTWWLTKAAMPPLSESPNGNVVMVTSIAGLRPLGSSLAYAMSKAALNHLAVLLAKACGPVRVNAVAPGLIATPWTEGWDEMHEFVSQTAPMARSGTPDDVAHAVVMLATNAYTTGEILVVDGGLTQVL